MSVCPAIDSAHEQDRDMRPISLEQVGPEVCNVNKIFS